ncbi:MAG: polyamine ABC transporter substrate-binding protein [Aeromonadaceae bacterium]
MKRCSLFFLLYLGLIPALSAVELVVYNWPFYLAPEVKNLFTQETGHTIKELYFDSEEARSNLLLAKHTPIVDVTVIDYQSLQHLSWSALFNDKPPKGYVNETSIEPRFLSACGQQATPYFWGSLGIAYRSSQAGRPITRWQQLFELEPENNKLAGHIIMVDDAFDLVSVALKSLGYSINTQDEKELQRAFNRLEKQKKAVLDHRLSLAVMRDPHLAEAFYAGMVYSGDFYSLKQLSKYQDWVFVAPEEGSPIWIDCLAINKKSAHPQEAAQLINFLQRPDIANLNGEKLGFAPTLNDELISSTLKQDPVAYPSAQHLAHSEYYDPSLKNDTLRNAIFFSVIK